MLLLRFSTEILSKDLPPPYRENEENSNPPQQCDEQSQDQTPCEVLDLLENCKISTRAESDSEVEYAEIEDMGLWHSTPLSNRHKSKISLTWVLKENIEKAAKNIDKINNLKVPEKRPRKFIDNKRMHQDNKERVVGRNEFYHNLRFKNAYDEFVNGQDSYSDTSIATEELRKKHRHKHRRKKRTKFGYDIRDLDGFLSEATIDRPGNIPVVVAFPTTLYQTQKDLQREVTLPLGTVVNAVFKNQQWLYVQTPHGDEGYVMYNACLPLGILPNRTSLQKKAPCWESSTDLYPRPCGNLTDIEKEQLRGRTRSESCHRTRERRNNTKCAEKDFDSLYLKTKSVSSNINRLHEKENGKAKTRRQTLLVVNNIYKGNVLNKTLSVQKGEVVVLVQGRGSETDVDSDWFYVKKRDGTEGFIPAAIAGHGFI